jgi:hypothetical protein
MIRREPEPFARVSELRETNYVARFKSEDYLSRPTGNDLLGLLRRNPRAFGL